VRPFIAGCCIFVGLSCREIQPFGGSVTPIRGYQLDGEVTTSTGVPVEGVDVRLYFNYQYVSDTPVDTQTVYVRDPSRPVDIAVYTRDFLFVKQLYLGYKPAGPLPRWTWDGFDAAGKPVPGGKYFIRYVVDTVIVKYSPVIVDGHVTATSATGGMFSIGSSNLPIGDSFDLFDQYNTYAGTYEVVPAIDISLRKGNASASYTGIQLNTNQITKNVFILE
jgi:hypothetical protein